MSSVYLDDSYLPRFVGQGIDRTKGLLSDGFQNLHDRQSGGHFDAASKRYVNDRVCLKLVIRSNRSNREHNVVFAALDILEKIKFRAWTNAGPDKPEAYFGCAADHSPVFGLAANPVECPKQMSVPSLVWFEFPKDVRDLMGECALMASSEQPVKVRLGIGDREMNFVRKGRRMGANDRVGGVIKASPEIGRGVECAVDDDIWEGEDLAEFVEFMRLAWVYLGELCKGLRIKPGADRKFKIVNMLICPQ